jgi:hypothetical protein
VTCFGQSGGVAVSNAPGRKIKRRSGGSFTPGRTDSQPADPQLMDRVPPEPQKTEWPSSDIDSTVQERSLSRSLLFFELTMILSSLASFGLASVAVLISWPLIFARSSEGVDSTAAPVVDVRSAEQDQQQPATDSAAAAADRDHSDQNRPAGSVSPGGQR